MATATPSPTRTNAAESVQLLNTPQTAAALGIGKRTLQELVAAREIASIEIGRSRRFHPDDIAAFVNRNRRKAAGWKGAGA